MMHHAMLRYCDAAMMLHLVFRAKVTAILRAQEAAAKVAHRSCNSREGIFVQISSTGIQYLCWLLTSDLLCRGRGVARRGAMGNSTFTVSVVAPALCAAVFLGLFLDQCSCQAVPQIVVLGGAAGWTDTANANYTQLMSAVQFKPGDTLRFNNNDTKDHDVYQVYTRAEYDTCNANNNTGWTVNVGDSYDLKLADPAYRVWIMDTQYCLNGQKVEFTVLNADGTAVPPDGTTADPPSLNAQLPDPDAPPPPPAAPLGLAGGPSPNAASSQVKVHWAVLALLVAACYLATPALQHRF